MVDAYRLERFGAKQGRVAMSPRIPDNEGVSVDTDGTRCLDYFTELMLSAERAHGDALLGHGNAPNIDIAIEVLTNSGRQKEAAIWQNFDWLYGKIENSSRAVASNMGEMTIATAAPSSLSDGGVADRTWKA